MEQLTIEYWTSESWGKTTYHPASPDAWKMCDIGGVTTITERLEEAVRKHYPDAVWKRAEPVGPRGKLAR